LDFNVRDETALVLFDAYNEFIGTLDDRKKRTRLEKLDDQNAADDKLFQELQRLSHRFQDGLLRLFFRENQQLRDLTQEYGVF
jgi:hypothetical protein